MGFRLIFLYSDHSEFPGTSWTLGEAQSRRLSWSETNDFSQLCWVLFSCIVKNSNVSSPDRLKWSHWWPIPTQNRDADRLWPPIPSKQSNLDGNWRCPYQSNREIHCSHLTSLVYLLSGVCGAGIVPRKHSRALLSDYRKFGQDILDYRISNFFDVDLRIAGDVSVF